MSPLAKALSVAILQNPAAARPSAYDNFQVRGIAVDRDGTEHVRMDRTYQGLPVIGGDLVVHSKAGVLKRTSITQAAALNLSVAPTIGSQAAITAAGTQFGTKFDVLPTSRLVVYARTAKPKLAYDVLYVGAKPDGTPTRMHYYVDAANGAILGKVDAIETGTLPGTGAQTGTQPAPPVTTPAI